ncbi:MAG: hypothetical protein ABIT70_08200 [Sulfuriferula sp.]
MADINVNIRVSYAWWVRPYVWLTRLGIRGGVPVDPAVVVRDISRGVRIVISG